MSEDRKFQVRQYVWVKEDVTVTRPGVGPQIYARQGDPVQVMSYDPSLELPYGVRLTLRNPDGSAVESYRNAQVKEAVLSATVVASAEPVGL